MINHIRLCGKLIFILTLTPYYRFIKGKKCKFEAIGPSILIPANLKLGGGISDNTNRIREFYLESNPQSMTDKEIILVPFGSGLSYISSYLKVLLTDRRNVALILHDLTDFIITQKVLNFIVRFFKTGSISKRIECIHYAVFSHHGYRMLSEECHLKSWKIEILGPQAPSLIKEYSPTPIAQRDVIAILGYWNKARNLADTVQAIGIFLALSKPEMRVIWAGIPNKFWLRKIQKTMKSKGIPLTSIEFHGHLNQTEYESILRRSYFIIHLRSSTSGESSGVVSEASLLRVPCIISNIGSNKFLSDFHLKIDSGNSMQLNKAIELLSDYHNMEILLRKYQSNQFSLEKYLRNLDIWIREQVDDFREIIVQKIKDPPATFRSMLLVDRDGTLNVDEGHTYDVKDLKVIELGLDTFRKATAAEWVIAVVTNQSGIGRGYYNLGDTLKFNVSLSNILKDYGITVTSFLICPHQPSDNCRCRKPATGLLTEAIRLYSPSEIVMIGNAETDMLAATKLNIPYISVDDAETLNAFTERLKSDCDQNSSTYQLLRRWLRFCRPLQR
jgi:histidinol-phosphate phosphatase family protein